MENLIKRKHKTNKRKKERLTIDKRLHFMDKKCKWINPTIDQMEVLFNGINNPKTNR